MKKIIGIVIIGIVMMGILAGCTEAEADTVSENLSKSADSFEVVRKVVFFNGITDKDLLIIEGRCSLGNQDSDRRMTVTCKTGKDQY